jgi:PTH2 family peptidyl-tRNA hydrolase
MIEDNGATEFNGVKTKTCCAIGPAIEEKFVGITDHLPLL